MYKIRTSLVVQQLRLLASTAGGLGSKPGWRTKIPHPACLGPWTKQTNKQTNKHKITVLELLETEKSRDFPDHPLVKNLPSKIENTESIPGGGTKISHAAWQLSRPATITEPMGHTREKLTCCSEKSLILQLRDWHKKHYQLRASQVALVVKNLPANAGDAQRRSLISG